MMREILNTAMQMATLVEGLKAATFAIGFGACLVTFTLALS